MCESDLQTLIHCDYFVSLMWPYRIQIAHHSCDAKATQLYFVVAGGQTNSIDGNIWTTNNDKIKM